MMTTLAFKSYEFRISILGACNFDAQIKDLMDPNRVVHLDHIRMPTASSAPELLWQTAVTRRGLPSETFF